MTDRWDRGAGVRPRERRFLSGSVRILALFTVLIVGIAIGLAARVWTSKEPIEERANASIPDPFVVEITGGNKTWSATYPDLRGFRGAGKSIAPGKNINLPLGTRICLLLKSEDYVYTFDIPQHGLKEIAVPTLEFRLELEPTKPGQIDLVGEPMCGEPHSEVAGRIVIVPRRDFLQWMRADG